MGIGTRRRAGVIVGLAGVLGGAVVGLSSVDAARSPVGPGGGRMAATTPPASTNSGGTGSRASGNPTSKGAGNPTFRSATNPPSTNPPSTSPGSTPRGGGTPPSTLRAIARTSPSPSASAVASPTASSTPRGLGRTTRTASPTPQQKAPTTGPTARPTPLSGTNNRNPNWKHDSQSWKQWDNGWQDASWRQEHSRDSRWHRFEDSGRREHDDFHFDEFRNEDRDFRHDCDTLLTFHSVRALLDFLDSDVSLRDFFELHGDLFDFLVHHSDWSGDFDGNCTVIDLHL